MERTALRELGALLDDLEIRWVLIGALAANRYRISPRLTQDVDLLLANTGPGLEALESRLRAASWSVWRASPEGELLRLRHPELGVADLMIAGTDYQQEALRRAKGADRRRRERPHPHAGGRHRAQADRRTHAGSG